MDGRKILLITLLAMMALSLVLGSGWALAGETGVVQVKVIIPEVLRLVTAAEPLVFDLGHGDSGEVYPPARFPAYYSPQGVARSGIPVRIFSNVDRPWTVTMVMESPLTGPNGVIPADRLEWSLDRTRWEGMSTSPIQIMTGGRGKGWQEWSVHFRLRVEGDEPGADQPYQTNIVFTLAGS